MEFLHAGPITAAGFDESKISRQPAGERDGTESPEDGGKFAPKSGTGKATATEPSEFWKSQDYQWPKAMTDWHTFTKEDVLAGRVPGIVAVETLREGAVAAHARDKDITVSAESETAFQDGKLSTFLMSHEAGHYVANEIQREFGMMSIPELEPFRTGTRLGYKSPWDDYAPSGSYVNEPGEILADTYAYLLNSSNTFEEPDGEYARSRQALLNRMAQTARKLGLPAEQVWKSKSTQVGDRWEYETVRAAGWDPAKHPKVPAGTSKGGQWARKTGYTPARATDSEGMRKIEEDFAANPTAVLESAGPGEDGALQQIAEIQGFTGPPEVVSHGELMERLPQWDEQGRKINEGDGTVELWRGLKQQPERHLLEVGKQRNSVPGAKSAEEFRYGAYYAGKGTYGNGIYAAEGRNVAVVYSDAGDNLNGDTYDRQKPYSSKSILHMGLKPEARVGLWTEVKSEWLAANGLQENNPGGIGLPYRGGVIYPNPPVGSLADAGARSIYADIGRFAASRGYDALKMDDGSGFWVIYNRTAIVVAEAPR